MNAPRRKKHGFVTPHSLPGMSAFLKYKSNQDLQKASEKCFNVYKPFISPWSDSSKIDEWISETFPENPSWAKTNIQCRK